MSRSSRCSNTAEVQGGQVAQQALEAPLGHIPGLTVGHLAILVDAVPTNAGTTLYTDRPDLAGELADLGLLERDEIFPGIQTYRITDAGRAAVATHTNSGES